MKPKKPPPPAHLSEAMKAFWRKITSDYELCAEHVQVLVVTCESFDRGQAARETIARDGMVLDNKRHPLLGVESKATELFLRGVTALGLEKDAHT